MSQNSYLWAVVIDQVQVDSQLPHTLKGFSEPQTEKNKTWILTLCLKKRYKPTVTITENQENDVSSPVQPLPELSQHQRSMMHGLQVSTRHLDTNKPNYYYSKLIIESAQTFSCLLTCRITLVSCGTTVTILDPLSTRRSVSSF